MFNVMIGLGIIIIYTVICGAFIKVTEGKVTSDKFFKTFRVLWIIIIILILGLYIVGDIARYIFRF